MTMPNAASGIDNSTWVTTDTVAGLPARTQDSITGQYQTQVGNDPPITAAGGVLGGFASIVNGLTGIVQSLINGFFGIFSGVLGIIGATITGLFSVAADFISGLFGGFAKIQDGIYNSVSGNNVSGVNWSDTGASLTGLKDTVVSLQSAIDNMKYDALPQGGAIHVDEGSSPVSSGWPSNWIITEDSGTTYVPASPGGFWWSASGNSARSYGGYYDAVTESDLQIVSMVLYTLMDSPSPATNDQAGNMLKARLGDNGTTYVYARVYYNRVELGYVIDGIANQFDTFAVTPVVGSLWELQCGTEGDSTEIIVYQNRQPVAGYFDTAGFSRVGAAYRGGGMTEYSDARTGATESTPGVVGKWAMRDVAPPGITGTALSVSRVGSGTVTQTNSEISSIQPDYFDTVNYCSTDLTWDTASSSITVTKSGQYSLKFSLLFNQWYFNVNCYPSYFLNTATGFGGKVDGSAGNNYQVLNVVGGWDMALNAGDVIQPALGIITSGDLLLTGDPEGQLAWMTLTKVG